MWRHVIRRLRMERKAKMVVEMIFWDWNLGLGDERGEGRLLMWSRVRRMRMVRRRARRR